MIESVGEAKLKKKKKKAPLAKLPAASRKKKKPSQLDSYTLADLDQVRVLADPLRLRIVEVLCEAEHTTKQIAELIGEKPTKLYHHVDALEKVGIIRKTRTRRNRGTLEKYYLAIARSFRTDPSTFSSPHEAEGDTMRSMVSTIFSSTLTEMDALIDVAEGLRGDMVEQGVLTYCEIRGTEKELRRIQSRIRRLVKDLQARAVEPDEDGEEPERRFRLTLAFFPLDIKAGSEEPDASGTGARKKRS